MNLVFLTIIDYYGGIYQKVKSLDKSILELDQFKVYYINGKWRMPPAETGREDV